MLNLSQAVFCAAQLRKQLAGTFAFCMLLPRRWARDAEQKANLNI